MRRVVAVTLVLALLVSGLATLFPGVGVSPALAADRGIVVSTPYPSVTTGKGKQLSFPININNKGSVDEFLTIEIANMPDGWKSDLRDRGFGVREVFVAAGKSADLVLNLTTPDGVKAGEYKLTVKTVSTDGQISSNLDLKIGITEAVTTGLKLSTQFPMLKGSPGSSFEFKLDLVNEATEDRTIDLSGVVPEGWEISFRPAYETKQISSLRVKAGETQGIDVSVTSATQAAPGNFPIKVSASAASDKASVDLSVTLTGSGKLAMSSSSGVYNAEVNAGGETIFAVIVQNTGVGDLQSVNFSASTPEGWDVTFEPNKLTELKAGAIQQVNVVIAPSSKAIAGDYVFSMRASSGLNSDSKDIRVTVTTSTVWGFVGILIVALVLVAMAGLYMRLGRR